MNRVHFRKNKIKGIFLSSLLSCALGFMLAGALMLRAPNVARAETTPKTLSPATGTAELFLPETSEQYLALSNPTSFDISDDYITVADGHMLYIYNRANGKYTEYEHMNPMQAEQHANISKVQIATVDGANNDRLFFSDSDLHLYEYQFDKEGTERGKLIDNVPATSFIVDETHNALFTANAPASGGITLTHYALNGNFTSNLGSTSITPARSPLLAIEGETLYLAYNDITLWTCPINNLSDETISVISNTSVPGIQSIERYRGGLYFTIKDQSGTINGLYRSENSVSERILFSDDVNDGLGALGVYKGELYCIRGKSVLKLAVGEDGTVSPTDYEITAASDSVNRLNAATDCVRAGNLIVTADTGNNRISVYNTETGEFQVIACTNVSHVATDGEVIVAAAGQDISVYEKEWGSDGKYVTEHTYNGSNGNIVGIACVYDSVYYVTQNNFYGVLNGNHVTKSVSSTPSMMASDLYGNIYVAYNDSSVISFTEETFLSDSAAGTKLEGITVPDGAKTMRAGFDGALYFLDENGKLCGEGGEIATIDGQNFVYTGGTAKLPNSFALGFEDDEVYFLFGDFIVKTKAGALGLETLESVSEAVLDASAGALSTVHEPETAQLADFKDGSVGIRVDLSALGGEGTYCSGYTRREAGRRGVILATYAGYSLVALYENHTYSVELFRREDGGTPFTPVAEQQSGMMYLASECTPYHYPCIVASPARAENAAPRGARVRVLSVLQEGGQDEALGGYDFAYIEYETEARAVERGYVPLAYLTAVDPLGSETQSFALGYVKAGATFHAADGTPMRAEDRVQARLYENGDGTYTAVYVSADGVEYTAQVTEDMIDWGESDALRIALIVILSVIACLIIGGYVFLLPKDKKTNKK